MSKYTKKRTMNIKERAREWVGSSILVRVGCLSGDSGHDAVFKAQLSRAICKLMYEAYDAGFDAGYEEGSCKCSDRCPGHSSG